MQNETNTACPQSPIPPQKRPTNPQKRFFIAIAVVFSIIITIAILILSHIICLNHSFKSATCEEPKTCEYCGKKEGAPDGHSYKLATCTHPKICKRCGKEDGSPRDHRSDWEIVTDATMTKCGIERLVCLDCGKILEQRNTDKKAPEISGEFFNFTDKEFIEWINSMSYTFKIDTAEIGVMMGFDSAGYTAYIIEIDDCETYGFLLLSHENNIATGRVSSIVAWHDDKSLATAIAMIIGHEISSDFSPENAIANFTYGHYSEGGLKAFVNSYGVALEPIK